jgi:hypothetical protein
VSDSPTFDAISDIVDGGMRSAPVMCLFPDAGPLGACRRAIARPVPKRITEPDWDGHYRLDYEGMMFSGYEWVPIKHEPGELNPEHPGEA